MDYKIKKLDRRMNGYGEFSHVIHFLRVADFTEQRVWFWDSFGPSCELGWWELFSPNDLKDWCWDSSEYRTRIYVSEAALAYFIMVNPT